MISKLKHPLARATLTLIAALALTSSVVAQQQESVEARLQGFDSYIDQVLKDWNTPGIGIVRGDKLVFAAAPVPRQRVSGCCYLVPG